MNKKGYYLFVICIVLSIAIIGVTYAYFTASASDEETVKGQSAAINFNLRVEKVTTADMAFGMVPMRNIESIGAANYLCRDQHGNAGCQIYRIIVETDNETTMFLDGYITTVTQDPENIFTRFTEIYTENEEESFKTFYTKETLEESILKDEENKYVKTGACEHDENAINRDEDYDCLLVENKGIGGTFGKKQIFYAMIWVYDDGKDQNFMQGMEQAYNGRVTFVSSQGNEISASFD